MVTQMYTRPASRVCVERAQAPMWLPFDQQGALVAAGHASARLTGRGGYIEGMGDGLHEQHHTGAERAVRQAVASARLEVLEPPAEQIALMRQVATGELTADDAVRRVVRSHQRRSFPSL